MLTKLIEKIKEKYSIKVVFLFTIVAILTWLFTMLGSDELGAGEAPPLMIAVAITFVIAGILLGEYADDIFEDKQVIKIMQILSKGLINGMLWTTFYIYVRKGFESAKNPATMMDGFYGGFATLNMVFWGELIQYAIKNFGET